MVRLVAEAAPNFPSEWSEIDAFSAKFGASAETIRKAETSTSGFAASQWVSGPGSRSTSGHLDAVVDPDPQPRRERFLRTRP